MDRERIDQIESQASFHKVKGEFAEALRMRQDLEQLMISSGLDASKQATNLNYIAFLALCVGDFAEAERAARRTLEVYSDVSEPSSEKKATYLSMLSSVLAERGSFEDAVRFGEESVAIFEVNHPDGDDWVARWKCDIDRMRLHDPGPYIDRGG